MADKGLRRKQSIPSNGKYTHPSDEISDITKSSTGCMLLLNGGLNSRSKGNRKLIEYFAYGWNSQGQFGF